MEQNNSALVARALDIGKQIRDHKNLLNELYRELEKLEGESQEAARQARIILDNRDKS